ncbi:hypothetical protein LCGC14_2635190 [marine sediment metagenome]|uniref:Uncharacterized protein n=1 Tax=marine sediment metagenome TaxID=412755 RepID=A0A0F9CRG4_9ZZZZ
MHCFLSRSVTWKKETTNDKKELKRSSKNASNECCDEAEDGERKEELECQKYKG